MEFFDIVDKNDKVIGKASRDECHSNPNLIHRTVHFTLINKNKNKVFLTQRSFNKQTDPGKLCFLGEHILTGETWEEGLIRGVQEELGFTPKIFKEVFQHIFSFSNQTEFVRFYIIEWNKEDINYDKKEIVKTKWLDLNDLIKEKSNYSDMTKFWIENTKWKKII